MAIDAVIERLRLEPNALRMELAPRVEVDGQDSVAGTTALRILGPRTFEPQVGQEIWGGATSVEIIGGPEGPPQGQPAARRAELP